MPKIDVTEDELWTITNALRAAAAVYRKDAEVFFKDSTRLAEKADKQACQCGDLIEKLDAIEVSDDT
jgi:hypothetical protein